MSPDAQSSPALIPDSLSLDHDQPPHVSCSPGEFKTPPGLLGRFGIVKLWPDVKVAEDEAIARLCNTAAALGLEAVIVDHRGVMIDPPHLQMTRDSLDFVIHLHFGTPKSYDIFSFVVLWNPLQFYHDFGYRRVSRHLLTHDDFLSCGSRTADDQIRRMILSDPSREGPLFSLYHSVSEPILAPSLGDFKLFYSGINWERLGKGPSRHQAILDELDLSGRLRIYGPRLLRNVQVWSGYQSYQGSLPFDGHSVVRAINRAGLALVLSSEAHIDSELMSNRLFEALAGGAVIICDGNPFASRHFGDSLLYVDTRKQADEAAFDILEHVRWVDANQAAALQMARKAQDIFQRMFRLDASLRTIYEGFSARRAHLQALQGATAAPRDLVLFLLVPVYDSGTLERQIANAKNQSRPGIRVVLVADEFDLRFFGSAIETAIDQSGQAIELTSKEFCKRDSRGHPVRHANLGRIIADLIENDCAGNDLVCIVGPNEQIYSDHLQLLAGALARDPDAAFAYSGILLSYTDGKQAAPYEVREALDLINFSPNFPNGCCRFLFKVGELGPVTRLLLPYLDVAALSGLLLYRMGVASRRTTAVVDIQHCFNVGQAGKAAGVEGTTFDDRLRSEQNLIRDVDPENFDRLCRESVDNDRIRAAVSSQDVRNLLPDTLFLDNLSRKNRQQLLVQLLKSLPVPKWVWSALRPFRPWRRSARLTSNHKELKAQGSLEGRVR